MNVPTCYAVRTVSRYRCLSWVSSRSPTARSQHGGTTSTRPSLAPSAVSNPPRGHANASACFGIQYAFQRRFGAVLRNGIAVAPEGVDEVSVLGGAARE